MNLQPTLIGNLLKLQPLGLKDFEELYRAASDPLIWEQHPASNRYRREVFEEYFLSAINSNGGFKVVDLESTKIIGSTRFYDFDSENETVVIGYTFLKKKYWGKGFNEEMKNLLLNYSFQFVNRVFFEVGTKNIRSQRAMNKFGAEIFISERILDGRSHIIFSIDKNKWTHNAHATPKGGGHL